MPTSSAESQLETIGNLITTYQTPLEDRNATNSLMLIADMIRLIREHTPSMATSVLNGSSDEVNAILSKTLSLFEALIGPMIGGLVPKAIAELEEKMCVHTERIDILTSTENPAKAYELLVATGWVTHLTADAWIGDDFERMLTKDAEAFQVRKFEYNIAQIERLFDRFVRQPGALGSVQE